MEAKVTLRLNHLPEKNEIIVLDAFAGKGTIWNMVQKRTDKKIRTLAIDKNYYDNIDIVCDNLKVIAGIDLGRFDIVDLDAYGIPFAQLQLLFKKKYQGIVFVTFIQSFYGNLPTGILMQSGFTPEMIRKARTLFTKKPLEVLETYLLSNKIENYSIKSLDRKHYLCFDTTKIKGAKNE